MLSQMKKKKEKTSSLDFPDIVDNNGHRMLNQTGKVPAPMKLLLYEISELEETLETGWR